MACGTPALGLAIAGAVDALAEGELGTAISEADLPHALKALLEQQKPAPAALAAGTRARFGQPAFAARVSAALNMLTHPA